MKIVKPIIVKHKFKSIKTGEVFGLFHNPYALFMKITECQFDLGDKEFEEINAVDLTDGSVTSFEPEDLVIPQPNTAIVFTTDEE